jgi:branched-chain amino acid transport system ATP-binding protein
MLEITGLDVAYGQTHVIHDVSLTVKKGDLFGLLGANNAGKTTIINAISGIVPPCGGKVVFEGTDITGAPPDQIVELGIIQVPEGRLVFPEMSVLDNLIMGAVSKRARRDRDRRMKDIFAMFPRLEQRRRQSAGTLSGGEQQMLAIGRALIASPRLLMLDEPSLGLSPLIVQSIFKILDDLHGKGLTMLLVEQNLNLTTSHATRCAVIERGQVVLEGSGQELRSDQRTRTAYLGL